MKIINGYLGTLDVLGFSELLYRDGYARKLSTYIDTINDVIPSSSDGPRCVVFSDSVVITAPGEDDEAFDSVVSVTSAVFYALLMVGIPVRGAIAFGKYHRQATRGSLFLAGRPIVEAYRQERSSKWVGTMLCPSAIRQYQGDLENATQLPDETDVEVEFAANGSFDDSAFQLAMRLQPATAPFSDSTDQGPMVGYGVVPIKAGDDDFALARGSLRRSIKTLQKLQIEASQPAAQAKYHSTKTWLREIEKAFSTVVRGKISAVKAERQKLAAEKEQ